MAISPRQQFLARLRENEADWRQLYAQLAQRLAALLLIYRDAVPVADQVRLRERIAAHIVAFYLARTDAGSLEPFTESNGRVTPLTPFMRLLWRQMVEAARTGVEEQSAMLRSVVGEDTDLLSQLERANLNPFTLSVAALLPVAARALFQNYQPPQAMVYGGGRTLEESIFDAAAETRRRVDALLRELLAEGKSGRQIADELARFLTPGALLGRANKPYGANGLARAEQIWRSMSVYSHAKAQQMAALLNPAVQEVMIARSHSAAKACPICDPMVAGSPYPVATAPIPGFHSSCRCYATYRMGDRRAALERLRESEIVNVRGALSAGFVDLLMRGS